MHDEPKRLRRRRSDRWNGKLKALAIGVGWSATLAGWAYNAGIHTATDNQQTQEISRNRRTIESVNQDHRDFDRDIALMLQSIESMEEAVRELRAQLRAHDQKVAGAR